MSLPAAAVFAENAGASKAAHIVDSGNSQLDRYIKQYQALITGQEKQHGAMDPQLGEDLLGLGLLYKNHGLYDKAGKVLNQALQIKRVNDGIQNMDQIPILKALIEVNTAAKNWDELNRNYQLLLWVNQRNLKSGDPAILPVIDMVGRWKLMAYTNGLLSEDPARTLSDIINLYQSTINILEELHGKNDPRLIIPLKGLAIARYQLAVQTRNTPLREFDSAFRRTQLSQQCVPYVDPRGFVQMVCGMVETPNLNYYTSKQVTKDQQVAMQMNSVRSSLTRIVKITSANPKLSPYERANALVDLGDWFFIDNMEDRAMENYKKAYQILKNEKDNKSDLDKLFGRPMIIPFATLRNNYHNVKNKQVLTKPYVKLTFSVTADGKARNIQIVEASDPRNYTIRNAARENIRSAVFRPRFLNGKPVATKKTELVLSGKTLESTAGLGYDPQDSIFSRTHIVY